MSASSPTTEPLCFVRREDLDIDYDGHVVTIDGLDRKKPLELRIEGGGDATVVLPDSFLRGLLQREGYFLLPDEFIPIVQLTSTLEGVVVELQLRSYDDVKLHALTDDPAIHLNVAAHVRADMRKPRIHIAEAKLQLGIHQHELAYRFFDWIRLQLAAGTLKLETHEFLELEDLTPDDIEDLLKRGAP